jgi:hypothetical protein
MLQAVRAFRAVPIEAYRLKTTVLAQLNAGDGYDDDSEDVGF